MLAWWRACEHIRIIEKYMSYLENLPSLSAYEKGQLFVLGGGLWSGCVAQCPWQSCHCHEGRETRGKEHVEARRRNQFGGGWGGWGIVGWRCNGTNYCDIIAGAPDMWDYHVVVYITCYCIPCEYILPIYECGRHLGHETVECGSGYLSCNVRQFCVLTAALQVTSKCATQA